MRRFYLAIICVGLLVISSLTVTGQNPNRFSTDFNHSGSGFSEQYPWELVGGELRYGGGDPEYDCDYNTFDHKIAPDFQYEIQAAWRGGDPKAGFGMIFRLADDQGRLTFEINHQGYFKTSYIREKWEITFDDWTPNSAIKPDGFNKLKVVCQGQNVQCYINDVLMAEWPEDAEYKTPVKVGVIALYGVKCAFDNFQLQELPVKGK
jgi:hypothetical protein